MFNWSHDPTYPVCLLRDCMRWWNAGVSWQSWCYHMFSLGEGKKKATLNPAKVIRRPEIQKKQLVRCLERFFLCPLWPKPLWWHNTFVSSNSKYPIHTDTRFQLIPCWSYAQGEKGCHGNPCPAPGFWPAFLVSALNGVRQSNPLNLHHPAHQWHLCLPANDWLDNPCPSSLIPLSYPSPPPTLFLLARRG